MDLITITRADHTAFKISVRGHDVICDLSEDDGGADAGPSPSELLVASLGACFTIMVQMYCQRHGWEGDAGVSLTMELADNPKRIGRIIADLELPEGVPDDKRNSVLRVAERCPIHETLRSMPAVDVDVA